MVAHTASSLGMNDSVISLIWVAAWNRLMIKPVTSATMVIAGPWMLNSILDYMRQLFSSIPQLVG